jgi:hypothetical protein
MSFIAPQIASILRRSSTLRSNPESSDSGSCFYDFIRSLLKIESLRIAPPFAYELYEAQKVGFTDIFNEDVSNWGAVCEFRHSDTDSNILDFYNSVVTGQLLFEPVLNSLLIPDPRSGIYHAYDPNVSTGPHFVVVSHGARRRTRFKERVHLAISAARLVGELHITNEISFKPLLPTGYVVGWVNDYLVFPYAGEPLVTLSDRPGAARSTTTALSQIIRTLAEQDCALGDLTPRNVLHDRIGERAHYSISDLENGASRSSLQAGGKMYDQWRRIINRNALDYLCLCRHCSVPDNDDLLSAPRIETAYVNSNTISCFEDTLLQHDILGNIGCREIAGLRQMLIRVFFQEPNGCQIFIMLKSLWDRLHPQVYSALLRDLLTRRWDYSVFGEMLAQATLITVACEYLNGFPEGRQFLQKSGLLWPSSAICEALVRACVDFVTDGDTGSWTMGSSRFWLYRVPRVFGLEMI